MTELIDKRKGKFQRLLRKRETQRKTRTIEKQKNIALIRFMPKLGFVMARRRHWKMLSAESRKRCCFFLRAFLIYLNQTFAKPVQQKRWGIPTV